MRTAGVRIQHHAVGNPSSIATAAIGKTDFYAALKIAQIEFENVWSGKSDETADLPLIRQEQSLLSRRLNVVLAALAEWVMLSPPPEVTALITKCDEIIIDLMGPVRSRRTRAETSPGGGNDTNPA